MRRWNGWGDDTVKVELTQPVKSFLAKELGPGTPPVDVTLQEAVSRVPASRLPAHPLISADPKERVCHCAGQSLGDWIVLRSGTVPAFPDGVAYPRTDKEVRQILKFAGDTGAQLIPYGGGTSVVGHLSVSAGDPPAITVDMSRMNRLLELDETGCQALLQAGVRGPDLEAALRAAGFTLGHYPQSFEYSTLGGWIATRSAGQLSLGYGRIEQMFAGGMVETPAGGLRLPEFPASAAGPDLRQLALGSEGRLGIITNATVRITPLPEEEIFRGAFFPGPGEGIAALREMTRAALPLAMLRLSLPEETTSTLAMAGESTALALLERWLKLRGVGQGKCMLLYGAAGGRKKVRWTLGRALEVIKAHRGVSVGARPGREWLKNRFRSPYLRNSLWEAGYAVDTLETATGWSRVPQTVAAVENVLRRGLEDIGERVFAFTHLSHVYPHGSSIYTTYLFRVAPDPAETMRRWRLLKKSASEAIVQWGGTISHQHGVGLDHRPYLEPEKGPLGMNIIQSLCATVDPGKIMNRGKLFN